MGRPVKPRYNENTQPQQGTLIELDHARWEEGSLNDRWDGFLYATRSGCDIETYDPNLLEKGPGMYRKDGKIVGVALSTKERSTYLSLAHPDTDPYQAELNREFLRKYLRSSGEKVGANIMYDLDWLQVELETPRDVVFHDVQFAEPLLDEYRASYSLDALCKIHGEEAKGTPFLEAYCNRAGWKGNPRAHIWRMPEKIVAAYAAYDARAPLNILDKQLVLLEQQGLLDVYKMETELIPLLLQMRRTGVRLDTHALGKTALIVSDAHYKLKEEISEVLGDIHLGSTAQLAAAFDKIGIPYPRHPPTEKMQEKGITQGNPNLDKESLGGLANVFPICRKILDYRHYDTLISMFFVPYMGLHVNGRLHCEFKSLRSDKYGTVSGRFSSTKPNLQQVSGTSEEGDEEEYNALHGKIVRNLFVPEDDCTWVRLDYSQIEYRLMAHYAVGAGAEEIRKEYRDDPATDYHQKVMDKTGFDRTVTKRLNFGTAYGMGVKTCSRKFGWTMEEAELFLDNYHANVPFVRASRKEVEKVIKRRGYIFTIMGRRARSHPSRAMHSMFNRLIQGSAADVMKKGMRDAYYAGIFNVLYPHLTVHDELDVSKPKTKAGEEAIKELKHTMENVFEFSVPLLVEMGEGERWGTLN